MGDECDLYRLSRFEQDPSSLGANEEISLALLKMKEMYSLFPNVKACVSNHTSRINRAAFRFGIPEMFLRSVKEWMKAPDGWRWKEAWEINEVRYFHGEPFTSTSWVTAMNKLRQSSVFGHTHHAGIAYSKTQNGKQIFVAQSGCLIDPDAYAFAYGRYIPLRPILGTTIVLDNGNRVEFIPLT